MVIKTTSSTYKIIAGEGELLTLYCNDNKLGRILHFEVMDSENKVKIEYATPPSYRSTRILTTDKIEKIE